MDNFSMSLSSDQIRSIINELGIDVPVSNSKQQWVTINSPLREDANPSFGINPITGAWIDHATGDKGDLVTLVEKQTGLLNGEAIKWAKEKIGNHSQGLSLQITKDANNRLNENKNDFWATELKVKFKKARQVLIETNDHELLKTTHENDGIHQRTLIEYGVGVFEEFGQVWLAFPYSNGCQLYRRDEGKKVIRSIKGSEPSKSFFGVTQLMNKADLFIAKSPRECMLLSQKYGDRADVIGLCGGEINILSKEQSGWLLNRLKTHAYDRIFTFLDADTEKSSDIASGFSLEVAMLVKSSSTHTSVYSFNVHEQTAKVSKDVTEAFDLGMDDAIFFAMLEGSKLIQVKNERHWFSPVDPLSMDVKPVDFIIDGYCAKGLITLIGGSAGSGKSMLNQYLFQRRDSSLLKSKGGKAIYLTGADASEVEVARRAKAIGDNRGLLTVNLPDNLFCTATNHDFMTDLLSKSLEYNVDAVIFDTIADFHNGNLYEPELANNTMRGFTNLARIANVAVIIITHTKKGSKTKTSYNVEDISDSRIFATKSDFVFGLRSEYQDDVNLIELQCLKSRSAKPINNLRAEIYSDEQYGNIVFRKSERMYQAELESSNAQETRDRNVSEAKRLKKDGKSYREIAEVLDISKSTVENYIKS